jgi:hypothetical protein|tara:strand:+ start:244 stop:534 length:291 start_codon:yes stop_codon:yes gene_type:complete
MTDEQMEKLAIRIADLVLVGLIQKQKEWDQQFTADVGQMMQDEFGNAKIVSQEELLLAEIARLMTLLSQYEEKQEYEKAAIIHNKIKILEDRLKDF